MEKLVTMMMTNKRESRFTVTDSMAKLALSRLDSICSAESNERTIIKILLSIEEKFRIYFESNQKELELQRIAAQTLWHLVQRYLLAVQVDTSCMCPKIYEIETEEAISTKYYMHYQVIVGSNKSQHVGIHALRPFVLAFRRACDNLDMEDETPFVMGDAFHKPIKFFIDFVDEIFNYFYSGHLQLECAARLLDPGNLKSLEYYQELLAPNEDFNEYFLHNLSYCKCLGQPLKCASFRDHFKKEKKDMFEASREKAKLSRCARRVEKMSKPKSEPPAVKRRISLFNSPRELSVRESLNSLYQRHVSLQHHRSLKFLLGNVMSVQHIH
ncbi:uncharacterized protein [Drosophila kikkawai]|uniref:Uncharacterized protein n=1 Tax=Drosophila kikkawai TaxID=30033 RepID=A0A6P4JDJ8_DROKI|nr:uncharacterized protein LOC108082608 [Drosophila kikkawai]